MYNLSIYLATIDARISHIYIYTYIYTYIYIQSIYIPGDYRCENFAYIYIYTHTYIHISIYNLSIYLASIDARMSPSHFGTPLSPGTNPGSVRVLMNESLTTVCIVIGLGLGLGLGVNPDPNP